LSAMISGQISFSILGWLRHLGGPYLIALGIIDSNQMPKDFRGITPGALPAKQAEIFHVNSGIRENIRTRTKPYLSELSTKSYKRNRY